MAQRPSRSLVRQVRENPLGCLSGFVAISLQTLAMWLSFTNWVSSSVDENRTAIAQAVGMLGLTFLLALLWNTTFRSLLNGAGAGDTVVSSDRSRVMRPSARVQRVAFGVWAVLLVFALAQLVTALSGNLGVALALGAIVPGLDLLAVAAVFVVHVNTAGRQH